MSRVKRTSESNTEDKKRIQLLRDDSLPQLESQDSFAHVAYADLLVQLIDSVDPPYTVGLFGPWGFGKTSVINEVLERLRDRSNPRTAAVVVDAWKYEGDSFRRQFLLDLSNQLRTQGFEAPALDPDTLYSSKTSLVPKLSFSLGRLKLLWLPMVLAVGFTYAAFLASQQLSIPTPLQAIAPSLIAGVVLYLVGEFGRNLIVQTEVSTSSAPYFSPEQFEKEFKRLMGKLRDMKIVIAVDNMDRCSRDRVIELFGAIKTFLEVPDSSCIFIVPCDDQAIRRHLAARYEDGGSQHASSEYAEKFLRKLFNTTIRMDPLLEDQVEPYARACLEATHAFHEVDDRSIAEIVQMIVLAFGGNPRRIKQFVNQLVVRLLLARSREAGPQPLIRPPISENVAFLAKVAVIEASYPSAYTAFLRDGHLYGEALRAMQAPEGVSIPANIETVLEENPGLDSFLRTSWRVSTRNPAAFFRMKQSPSELLIPGYEDWLEAVRTGNQETAFSLVSGFSEEQAVAAGHEVIRYCQNSAIAGYSGFALNALSVGLHLSTNVQSLSHLGPSVARVLSTTPSLLEQVYRLDVSLVLEAAQKLTKDERTRIVDSLVRYFGATEADVPHGTDRPGLNKELLAGFIAHMDFLKPSHKREIQTRLAKLDEKPKLLAIAVSSEEGQAEFVTQELLVGAVQEADAMSLASPIDHEDSAPSLLGVLSGLESLWSEELADGVADGIQKGLLEAEETQNTKFMLGLAPVVGGVQELLRRSPEEKIQAIAEHLRSATSWAGSECLQASLRILVLVASLLEERGSIWRILQQRLVQERKVEALAELLLEDIWRGVEDFRDRLLEAEANQLATQSQEADRKQVLQVILGKLLPQKRDIARRFLRACAGLPAMAACSLLAAAAPFLPKGTQGIALMSDALGHLLGNLESTADPAQENLIINLLTDMSAYQTRAMRKRFVDYIVATLKSWDPIRQLNVASCLNRMLEDEYWSTVTRVALPLVAKQIRELRQRPLPEYGLLLLEAIQRHLEDALPSAEDQTSFTDWLIGLLIQPGSDDERLSLTHLLAMCTELPELDVDPLIPRIIGFAERLSSSPVRDELHRALLKLHERHDPSNQERWEDLGAYQRRLLASDQDQDVEDGRSLRKARRAIRAARSWPL